MSDKQSKLQDNIEKLQELTEKMRDAEKPRTLEEQVAYLKSKGIDPSKTYANWDDEEGGE